MNNQTMQTFGGVRGFLARMGSIDRRWIFLGARSFRVVGIGKPPYLSIPPSDKAWTRLGTRGDPGTPQAPPAKNTLVICALRRPPIENLRSP